MFVPTVLRLGPQAPMFFTLSRLSRFVGVPTWRAARVVRNTTNAYVYSPVSP